MLNFLGVILCGSRAVHFLKEALLTICTDINDGFSVLKSASTVLIINHG